MDVKKLYKYYKYNIYTMINKLYFRYEFSEIWKYRVISFSQMDYDDFTRLPNSFLLEYQHEKTKLAEDIIKNGMYFPFYGGRIDNQKDENLFFILQGKHRFYSLKLYNELIDHVSKKFLFISYPIDIQNFNTSLADDTLVNPVYMYKFIKETKNIGIVEINSYTSAVRLMDTFGSIIGEYIFSLRKQGELILGPDFINNEDAMIEFLSDEHFLDNFNIQNKEG